MDKIVLALLIFRIIITAIAAIFLVISIYDTCVYHDRDSLLLSILWAVILIICIASIIWMRKVRNKSL
jgi:hypothetical protein